jgi:hypothetical protein
MFRAFTIIKRVVVFLVGAFVAAIIAFYVAKYLEKHDLVDATSAVWSRAMTWVDYLGSVLSQPWFWPTFCGLTGFAGGLYLDAFMRRWGMAAVFSEPDNRQWLSSYKIFELIDQKLLQEASDAEAQIEKLAAEIERVRKERRQLDRIDPLGGTVALQGPQAEALRVLSESAAEAQSRMTAAQQYRSRARGQALNELYDKLRSGEFVAKGYVAPADSSSDEIEIPSGQWRLIRFNGDYTEASSATIKYIGIAVAANKRS